METTSHHSRIGPEENGDKKKPRLWWDGAYPSRVQIIFSSYPLRKDIYIDQPRTWNWIIWNSLSLSFPPHAAQASQAWTVAARPYSSHNAANNIADLRSNTVTSPWKRNFFPHWFPHTQKKCLVSHIFYKHARMLPLRCYLQGDMI
jgi:hypothetical protein